jgi:hypothetical protein
MSFNRNAIESHLKSMENDAKWRTTRKLLLTPNFKIRRVSNVQFAKIIQFAKITRFILYDLLRLFKSVIFSF